MIALGNGNDTVFAGDDSKVTLGNGNDTVYAGARDAITLGTGHDTVAFGLSPGQTTPGQIGSVTINQFDASKDVIKLTALATWDSNFTNLGAHIQNDAHGNAVIALDASGDTVTLTGVSATSLHAANFKFV
jgi:hypothetical protein